MGVYVGFWTGFLGDWLGEIPILGRWVCLWLSPSGGGLDFWCPGNGMRETVSGDFKGEGKGRNV